MATVRVQVLDGEYQVRCAENQVDELRESARDLDGRMRQIRNTGQIYAVDRLAVLAALNIAHDNRHLRRRLSRAEHDAGAIAARVDEALASSRGAAERTAVARGPRAD